MKGDVFKGEDGYMRCSWCAADSLYMTYHDDEWGRPIKDDRRQFEFLVLESAQAGLSWHTILRKREAYRRAYADFDPLIVSHWGENDVAGLLENSGIVRNRRKIEASIVNARIVLELAERRGSFSEWLWDFVDGETLVNHWKTLEEIPATTPLAETMAKEMKALGFRFLGPTILYAHMQATGLVDDHLMGCWRRTHPSGGGS